MKRDKIKSEEVAWRTLAHWLANDCEPSFCDCPAEPANVDEAIQSMNCGGVISDRLYKRMLAKLPSTDIYFCRRMADLCAKQQAARKSGKR